MLMKNLYEYYAYEMKNKERTALEMLLNANPRKYRSLLSGLWDSLHVIHSANVKRN